MVTVFANGSAFPITMEPILSEIPEFTPSEGVTVTLQISPRDSIDPDTVSEFMASGTTTPSRFHSIEVPDSESLSGSSYV